MWGSLQLPFQDSQAERRRCTTRLVTKDGYCNIEFENITYRQYWSFMGDFWTTVIRIRWRFVLFFFIASFTLSWFIFSLIWFWIAHDNGDLTWQKPAKNHSYCVNNLEGLTTAFLYSLETQTTIGYGGRAVNPTCPGAVAILIIQTLLGVIINCFMTGLIMAKITSPKKRAETIIFSEMAVICSRNGALCLSIQVANLRKCLIFKSRVYGKLLHTRNTPDGEIIIMDKVHNINFNIDTVKNNFFFVRPLTLYHTIDHSSPFFEMTEDTLHNQEFELVVFLDGTAESTSSSCQARTSYIPHEIMWGYEFLPNLSRIKNNKYSVDFSNFSKVTKAETAHCVYCFHNMNEHITRQDNL